MKQVENLPEGDFLSMPGITWNEPTIITEH